VTWGGGSADPARHRYARHGILADTTSPGARSLVTAGGQPARRSTRCAYHEPVRRAKKQVRDRRGGGPRGARSPRHHHAASDPARGEIVSVRRRREMQDGVPRPLRERRCDRDAAGAGADLTPRSPRAEAQEAATRGSQIVLGPQPTLLVASVATRPRDRCWWASRRGRTTRGAGGPNPPPRCPPKREAGSKARPDRRERHLPTRTPDSRVDTNARSSSPRRERGTALPVRRKRSWPRHPGEGRPASGTEGTVPREEERSEPFTFTSESVNRGIPNKMSDKISESDSMPSSRGSAESASPCETLCTTGLIVVGV